MILAVMTYFSYTLATSILRYYEYGTVTDIQVNYVSSVKFPAVTLCNQNNFRFVNHIATLGYSRTMG